MRRFYVVWSSAAFNTKECAVCKGVSLNAIRTQKSRIKSKLM